jgi:hypothetical protein
MTSSSAGGAGNAAENAANNPWDWVATEVTDIDAITENHRRRVYGFCASKARPFCVDMQLLDRGFDLKLAQLTNLRREAAASVAVVIDCSDDEAPVAAKKGKKTAPKAAPTATRVAQQEKLLDKERRVVSSQRQLCARKCAMGDGRSGNPQCLNELGASPWFDSGAIRNFTPCIL